MSLPAEGPGHPTIPARSRGRLTVISTPCPSDGRSRTGAGIMHPTTCDRSTEGRDNTMATVLIFHEVDDVDRWVRSPKREEFFGPLGMTARTFVDPTGTNRVGLVAEVPDLETLQAALATEAAADAMKSDGVRPETIVMLVES